MNENETKKTSGKGKQICDCERFTWISVMGTAENIPILKSFENEFFVLLSRDE